ncbi:Autophagy-related protein-like protein [Hapsidospora chrysogenum ATCC 11550]|uniref:Autophagy-related protein 27 n=1 Tax=Hapsidospora chrysogenum (strain ATCC 11550 / CBS 779.69 / DSM 880 / IAM 14645 / JCM 23072 / IMI 49137) TaxID=857340 RepID=A0A086TGQ3_HAPC1|nr:Autophagy-related protein-like protein [Hapsidospora chrysogenum ATCC 11550]
MYLPQASAIFLPLLLAPLPAAANLQCDKIVVEGHNFNLKELGGPHSVVTSRWDPETANLINTTYTVDICQPLKKSGKVPQGEECPNGTWGMLVFTAFLLDGFVADMVTGVIAIAGTLQDQGGSKFEYEATRLKTSDSNSDSKKEGLRLVLKGGKHKLSDPVKKRRDQRAVIEFLCDPEKTGLEGEWDSEERYDGDRRDKEKEKRDDEGEGDGDGENEDDDEEKSTVEHQLLKEDTALLWESYGPNEKDDADVLRLTWSTKYACEKRDDDDGESDSSGSWGFFTWLIIIAFLAIAAYLIFGSWLNYTRYGARGWDLIPHGDTIRDIPYLLKDWMRRVLNTVQGTGSRGGYSAV